MITEAELWLRVAINERGIEEIAAGFTFAVPPFPTSPTSVILFGAVTQSVGR